jgi:hypothetical protein
MVKMAGSGEGPCPDCGCRSASRHSRHVRVLNDLPVQCAPVTLEIRLSRLTCREPSRPGVTFVEPAGPGLERFARMTGRVPELVLMAGHAAGGRPVQRLSKRLELPGGTDTILRYPRRRVAGEKTGQSARAKGIDDWA